MTRKKNNNVHVFTTIEALNESVAQLIVSLAEDSVAERGRFVLSLSGGKTPDGVYTLLSMKPFRDLVPWRNTFVFWSDERCVPGNDERNNAHRVSGILLKKVDLPASNIFPVPVNLPPAEAAYAYEQTLHQLFGKEQPRFDIILLGLGKDGHTASLFPRMAVLNEKSRWVKEVFVDDQQMDRITMTLPLINKARHVLFLVEGEEKSKILEKVLTASSDSEKYPAQLIRPAQGKVYWYADDKAASRLPECL